MSQNVVSLATSLALGAAPHEWRDGALCRDTDPGLFFPIGSTGPAVDLIEQAKRVCAQCPVAEPCLEFAVETRQDAGVWGGRTEEERRTLRRRRAAHTPVSAAV